MLHFLRLLRPLNLLIIALTMFGLAFYFDLCTTLPNNLNTHIFKLPFILLVVSTVMIAAAGNIINDYFDVKADRVNRPDKLIIGKHIKRRWAILMHWILNVIAFAIACYLSYTFKTFWYVFIHLLSINLLWYYSSYLKRTMVVGNIVIALLTALVPVLVGIFYNSLNTRDALIFPLQNLEQNENWILYFCIILGGFAFFLNWSREIVKDIEDIEGDKLLRAKTLPISLGEKKAKIVSSIILLLPVVFTFAFYPMYQSLSIELVTILPIFFSAFFVLISLALIWKAKSKKQYKLTHNAIKLAMIAGLSLPIYWIFIS